VRTELKRLRSARTILISLTWAVICVAAALIVTLLLQRLSTRIYFILFVPAVMFSTWFGGLVAGMIASLLTVIATVLLLPAPELVDHIAWIAVAALVAFGTGALTARRRQAEEQLAALAGQEQRLRRQAESVSELKTEWLTQVAHELRQPLSAIRTAAHLLDKQKHDAATTGRAVGVIVRQSDQLQVLIEDLLELSKLNRQELQLRRSRLDLCEIVDDSLHVVAAEIDARRLQVRSALPACPLHVMADPTRVRQIVTNLLSNAVKFTPPGGEIDLAVEGTESHVVIRVRDTGLGIEAERLPHIFEMFQKGDGDGAGLGIGLAVVKGLTELHGGSVEARSAGVGRGSEFIVTLPLAVA
jgi:signal transduction histidine kinase